MSEVVVVRDTRVLGEKPGRYALVRSGDWCGFRESVELWRGPKKHYEKVEVRFLVEVSCVNLLVDKKGFFTCKPTEVPIFYPCPQVDDTFVKLVKEESEKILEQYANEYAAESISYVDFQETLDKLGKDFENDIFVVADFDEAFAVNGEWVSEDNAKPPRGWERSSLGGRTDGSELELSRDNLYDPVFRALKDVLKKSDINPIMVDRILDQLYPEEYVYWQSAYGTSEIWLSTPGTIRLEEIEEKERAREAEQERKRREAAILAAKRERERELEEHRRKLKKGGVLAPREWSPRGRLPGEE